MSIPTASSLEDRKENLKKIKEFHKATLSSIGVSDYSLIPKLAYRPSGKTELHVSFFHSEISKGHDVYLEFTDRNNVPEDPERTLYLWKFNPHFEEEYEKTEPTEGTGHMRYLVPVEELKVIKRYSPEATITTEKEIKLKQSTLDFSLPDPDTDPPINDMTIRDLAAIILGKPVSNKEWLNKIIKSK
jgi:hypothetical protein